MDYLILYYDLDNMLYKYRVASCLENAERLRKELIKKGIKTIYIYSLFNKFNLINNLERLKK